MENSILATQTVFSRLCQEHRVFGPFNLNHHLVVWIQAQGSWLAILGTTTRQCISRVQALIMPRTQDGQPRQRACITLDAYTRGSAFICLGLLLNTHYPPIYTFCTKSKVTGTDIKFFNNHKFSRQARRWARNQGDVRETRPFQGNVSCLPGNVPCLPGNKPCLPGNEL